MNSLRIQFVLIWALSLPAIPAKATQMDASREWNFDVTLDGDDFGSHSFAVAQVGDKQRVDIKARFKYKLLFVTAFRYEHQNRELWQDNCLHSISSSTDNDGEDQFVRGRMAKDGLKVVSHRGSEVVAGCVMSFAYWNPDILKQDRLLNSQTGELMQVRVKNLGKKTIPVRGQQTAANHYRMELKEGRIDLWYDHHGDWLSLESETADGHILRYELR
jgi:hypothetical protein